MCVVASPYSLCVSLCDCLVAFLFSLCVSGSFLFCFCFFFVFFFFFVVVVFLLYFFFFFFGEGCWMMALNVKVIKINRHLGLSYWSLESSIRQNICMIIQMLTQGITCIIHLMTHVSLSSFLICLSG